MLVEMANNELLEKYNHFKQILSDNYSAMHEITELEECFAEGNTYGKKIVTQHVQNTHNYVKNMVDEFSSLTGEDDFEYYGYNQLYAQLDQLDSIVDEKMNKKHKDLSSEPYVVNFENIDKDMVYLVGGKCASLGELISNTDVPVPGGFAVTTKAYRDYIAHNNLQGKIEGILDHLDVDDTAALNKASSEIKTMIKDAEMPQEMIDHIKEQYTSMIEEYGSSLTVAVRSSGSAEDLPDASFAGLHDSFLNINEHNLIDTVKDCFASMYNARAIFYRDTKGFAHDEVALSVAVQKMVNSEVSGIMFSRDPTVKDKNIVAIDAIYGLGEYIVGGKVSADHYIVTHENNEIIEKGISEQTIQLVNSPGGTREIVVDPESGTKQKASDAEIKQLARFALALEKHYGVPQDIEWARDADDGHIYIVQSRPITVMDSSQDFGDIEITGYDVLLDEGITASGGVAYGPVYVVNNTDDLENFPEGAILVSKVTSPDYVPALKKAAGVITDSGSFISHAAIVAREFGIPAIVGAPHATEVLESGKEITMNAGNHIAYDGEVKELTDLLNLSPEREEEVEEIEAPQPPVPEKETNDSFFSTVGKWIGSLFSQDYSYEEKVKENKPIENVEEVIEQPSVNMNTINKNQSILSYFSPLHLTDASSEDFAPENCTSYHDIVRFVHEKAIHAMFNSLKPGYDTHTTQIYAKDYNKVNVLDIDGALNTDKGDFKPENITSPPLKAIVDFYDGLKEGQKNNGDYLRIIATSDYVNASMSLGCHSATFDSMCTDIDTNNYVSVKYVESYSDHRGSQRRKELVRRVLAQEGFSFKDYSYESKDLNAELKGASAEQTQHALAHAVSILGSVKDLDLKFDRRSFDDGILDKCVDEFNKGNYNLYSVASRELSWLNVLKRLIL